MNEFNNAYTNQLQNDSLAKGERIGVKNQEIGELQSKLNSAESEIRRYERLLARPMEEIAKRDKAFAETYRKQQEFLANWMVSQKAFKELAIKFGVNQGLDIQEVIDMGMANKEKVLNNKTEFENNAEGSTYIGPHIEALKAKLGK